MARIRLLSVAVLASAIVVAPLAAPAAAEPPTVGTASWPANTTGKGCAPPTWPKGDKSVRDLRVLVIGDSLIRDSRKDLEKRLTKAGYLPSVRCWGAMGSHWGARQVKQARRDGQLPQRVVVALGTNDVWWRGVSKESAVDRMMAALGPKRTVYWVNLWFGRHGYKFVPNAKQANKVLRQKAQQYPNLRIIDFEGAFKAAQAEGKKVGWRDGVHLNDMGYRVRNEAIVAALKE